MNLKFRASWLPVACLLFSQYADAACFPPNKLHLQPTPLEKSNVSKAEFNRIIDAAEKIYEPIVRSHRAKLKFNRLWSDETVNASANQDGSVWEVNMYGGLARRPEITPDGFAMVVCHELGHHLGGYSFYDESEMTWAANEGQSDYFATHACAKEVWKDQPELNAKARETVLPLARRVCDLNYAGQADRDICYRSSNAGLSLATLLAKLRSSPVPKFETPDPQIVDETYSDHPEAQCRLDTYLAGSACSIAFKKELIPAKKLSNKFGEEAEREAGKYSCLARDGWISAQRPRCWFKPLFEFEGLAAQQFNWTDSTGNGRAEPGESLALVVPLENKLSKNSEKVTGELFSKTPGVTVVNPKVSYPDIVSGSTQNPDRPFEVKVSRSFKCGRPFELTFRASALSGSRDFPVKWFVGPKIADDFILGQSTKDIQIPDSPAVGIAIPMNVSQKIEADTLALDLEIEGLYPEENEFTLRMPNGEKLTIDVAGLFERGSKATAVISLPKRMSLSGAWTLNIRDTQENDTIVLKSYSLRSPMAEQVACSR
jgi:hypothetical protein